MDIFNIIAKDLPSFSGICIREAEDTLADVRDFGISLAWNLNRHRAGQCKQILIAGNGADKGHYFTADIVEVLSIKEVYEDGKWEEALAYQENIFGAWITARTSGQLIDHALERKSAIVFANATKIEEFSEVFSFSRGSVYYKQGNNIISTPIGEFIEIENIAKITSANIKLSGLTLIAGVNRTGKSTIGKTLFSIIKGANLSQESSQFRNPLLFKEIEKLYFRLRQIYDLSRNEQINQAFKPVEFLKEIEGKNKEELEASFLHRENLLAKLNGGNLQELRHILTEVKKLSVPKENEFLEKCLNDIFAREFQGELSPKSKEINRSKTNIRYKAGVNTLLEIEVARNKITNAKLVEEGLIFKDAIYIETPLFLQLYQLVKAANLSHVALHITDLMEKIEKAKYEVEELFDREENTVIKKIIEIIEGGFVFNEAKEDFVFEQKVGEISIKPTNTASGIKSFGIIQLLLQANILNDSTLLIIDEPENHLHPEWQVKYAEMIIALVKNEITVIINSHSPYMIQALKYYSEKEQIQHRLNYYFAELSENGESAALKEVTTDLNVIFSKLSKPLTQLVWQ